MSQKVKQKVSAFIDDQKDVSDVVDNLKQDKELASTYSRYHLIGDVMRNDVPEHIQLNLADVIADAIEKEPVVLSPNAAFSASVSEKNTATEPKTTTNKVVSFFKPVMQYGIAASFAAAIVVGFQAEQASDEAGFEPVIHTMPLATGLDPVSAESSRTIINPSAIQEQQRRVNSYILDHSKQLKSRQYATPESNEAAQTQPSSAQE
ncbi:sigma-E factor negative regulatory protein [Algibacillus agarilyticus]|uniref:sigma-E factor negative regulatory protein n=1 Tax=Algibacillus agarilyticus TaxID=2234133 RepID=UPI000DD02CA3|nr:RseA family anti-sigma factor [Algibacillus agarilyticus]